MAAPAEGGKEGLSAVNLAVLDDFLQQPRVLAALAGILFFIGYSWIYKPYDASLSQVRKSIAAVRERQQVVDGIESAIARINAHSGLFPKKDEIGWWLKTLVDAGQRTGIKIDQISPKSVEELGDYELLSVDIDFQGRFPQLLQLLESLEKMERLIRVDALSMSRSETGERSRSDLFNAFGGSSPAGKPARGKPRVEPWTLRGKLSISTLAGK